MRPLHLMWLLGPLAGALGPSRPLASVLKPTRVTDDHYRLIMFRTDSGAASGFALVERAITHGVRDGQAVIRIQEDNRSAGTSVTVYLEPASLAPIAYDSRSGDTLSVSATLVGDSLRIITTRRTATDTSTSPMPAGAYWSNSFSELLQSNDFNAHPSITFTTITPGMAANSFTVERIGRRDFGRGLTVWVLQFTRMDSKGATVPSGYRYLDVRTGKVLFFTTALDAPSGFSYQVLPLR